MFIDQVAFLGSGRNEPCAVYLAVNGVYTKISTMEIDTIIQEYSENQLAGCVLEARIEKSHAWLYLHLPNATYVYDFNASQITGEPFWFQLDSALGDTPSQYQARFLVWVYDKWIFGDPTAPRLGTFSLTDGSAYGEDISWQFQTVMIYNHGPGLIVHELELMAITGAVKWATKPTLSTSYSFDGITWSQDRTRSAGKQGQRDKRLNWLACGSVRRWRIQRFKGTSAAHMSFLALEARISPLAW